MASHLLPGWQWQSDAELLSWIPFVKASFVVLCETKRMRIINSLKNQSKITINMFVLWDLQTSIQIWTVSHTLWSFGEKNPGRQVSGRWNQLESVSWRFNIQRQSRLWYVPEKGNHKKWSLLTVLHQFAHNKSGKFSLCYWLTSAKKHQPFGTCWPVKLHPGEIEAMGQKLDDLDSSRLYVGEFGFRGFHQWDSGQSQCEHGLVPWIPILEGKTGWMWTSIRSIMRTSNFFGKPHIFWLHSFGKAPRLSEILIDSCHLYRRLFTQRGLFLLLINTAFHRGISQISQQTK